MAPGFCHLISANAFLFLKCPPLRCASAKTNPFILQVVVYEARVSSPFLGMKCQRKGFFFPLSSQINKISAQVILNKKG